jgi:hypothetical protein
MALTKNESKTIFLSISDGNIVRQFKEPNERTKQRTTKTGKLVHEERFRDLTGMLTKIESRENDFGKQLTVHFTDGSEYYSVSMPYSSRYSSSLLKAIPNLDLTQPIKLMPWAMQDKNDSSKTVTGITLYQSGNKIAPAFTKDNPGEMPQMRQIKVKGKITWDDSDMMDWLEANAKSLLAAIKPDETADAPF